ncbi:MAG: HAD family phosphatase [Candidatus Diapherotrites archaeon]
MIKIVFIDMSNTLVNGSGSNSGADFLGKGDTYRRIYPEFKSGKISMEEWLAKTFACWKGLKVSDLPKVYEKLELNEGAKETITSLKKKKIKTVLLTNIPRLLAELFQKKLGFDFITGTVLEVKEGAFTGKILEFHNDKSREAMKILEQENIRPDEAVSVGDRKDDAEVFRKVKFGIAYNGDEAARKNAKYNISNFGEILKIIEKESN